jgi:hypothetical protein
LPFLSQIYGDHSICAYFHYFATYVASRFVGYDKKEAKLIASSAQMIDENARHTLLSKPNKYYTGTRGLPDDFEIRESPTGPVLHTYRVQQTFQLLGDIGTANETSLSSIWPVFHFLPGNFDVDQSHKRYISPRWRKRKYTAANPSQDTLLKFKNLCRPHSPMAIALVNNCKDLVNDENRIIKKKNLHCYLIGVSMHVFVDTWAHQDFVGIASESINNLHHLYGRLSGKRTHMRYRYINPYIKQLPELYGDEEPDDYIKKQSAQGQRMTTTDVTSHWTSLERAPGLGGSETSKAYTGHGRAGHLPDHSSLIWDYHPFWSDVPITRYNPIVYWDAFIHLLHALTCIKNNTPYMPENLEPSKTPPIIVDNKHLLTVYELLSKKRHPLGDNQGSSAPKALDDLFDRSIYEHSTEWIMAIQAIFPDDGFTVDQSHWLPGESDWVLEAREVLTGNKKMGFTGYTLEEFNKLDFFKFNVAAKQHYLLIKEQLMAFNQKLVADDWADGAAYEDFGWLNDSINSPLEQFRKDALKNLRNLQRTAIGDAKAGITILIDDVVAAKSIPQINDILSRENYGLEKDSSAQVSIKGLSTNFKTKIENALSVYAKETKGFFTKQSAESTAAVRSLSEIITGTKTVDLKSTVLFLLGSNKAYTSDRTLRPLKNGSRLYNLLLQALRDSYVE